MSLLSVLDAEKLSVWSSRIDDGIPRLRTHALPTQKKNFFCFEIRRVEKNVKSP